VTSSLGSPLIDSSSESDEDLCRRLRLGDREALACLFHRHAADLVRLAAGIAGSIDDGQDIVQDVFLGLEIATLNYEARGAFAGWLRAVTIRTALAARRRSARRRETSDYALSQLRRSGDIADAVTVSNAVESLPEALREVFLLKVVAGYSHAEIGAMLGIRSNTSEVRLFRAIRQLRSLLSGDPT
jgi:RNA polymerase sigma-70 factor, ECF subfamily